MDIAKLHRDTRDLLERLADRLPQDKLATYRSLSDVGDSDELLDVLAASLIHRHIPVTPQERDALADLLGRYPDEVEFCEYINHRDDTLAALIVTS